MDSLTTKEIGGKQIVKNKVSGIEMEKRLGYYNFNLSTNHGNDAGLVGVSP